MKDQKHKFLIGFDMDGIIANLHQAWLDWYNKTWNDKVPLGRLQWDLKAIVKKECGNKIYTYLRNPSIYETVLPIDGAIPSIQHLIKAGHDVIIVTHPAGGSVTVPDKTAWLKRYLPEIKEENIIFTSRKDLLKLDIFVDDSPKNIIHYRKAWPDSQILTIAWPYNEEVVDLVDLRANSYKKPAKAWNRIVEYIEEL